MAARSQVSARDRTGVSDSRGRLVWPAAKQGKLTPAQVSVLLEGIDGCLRPFRDHGLPEPDATAAKRGLRALASGRRTDRLVGCGAGGKTAAIACPLIETARLNAADPTARCANTPARIPDDEITKPDDPLPWW